MESGSKAGVSLEALPVLLVVKPGWVSAEIGVLRRQNSRPLWAHSLLYYNAERYKNLSVLASKGHKDDLTRCKDVTMNQHEVVSLLNDLIETCKHGENCFRASANHVQSSELSMILVFLGDNCQQRARELENYVVQLGGHPFKSRRTSAALQRAWLSVRSLFSRNANFAMLKECKRREDKAVSHYRKALEKSLPEPLRAMVERQYLGAKCNNNRIRDLLVLDQVIWPTSYRHPSTIDRRSLRTHLESGRATRRSLRTERPPNMTRGRHQTAQDAW